MVTFSLCMIVKNEEKVLARCLDSIADIMDEIIIVDTGSLDATREIAARYTDRVFDFEWIDDFAKARNFAFSKATKDYIYSADADEVLDEENRERLRALKKNLLPEIEIVQMKYGNQLEYGTVYNFDEEYRPKLFKRLREFTWIEPIHESVRLDPVVFDSDIVITHKPHENHAKRDIANFEKQTKKGLRLSKHLHSMYARELFLAGDDEDFLKAEKFFLSSAEDIERSSEEVMEANLVLSHIAGLKKDGAMLLKHASKLLVTESSSEICIELGNFFEGRKDYTEAAIWYYNAVYEVKPVINLRAGGELGLNGLIRCYRALGNEEAAAQYERELINELGK